MSIRTHDNVSHDIGSRCLCASSHPCVMRLCVWPLFYSPLCTLHSLSHLLLHPPDLSLHLLCGSVRREIPCALPRMKSLALWPKNTSSTGYEPKYFDDYHISETTEIFIQESSSDTRPSYLHNSGISDYTIGKALSSPLFTQEQEEPAGRRQAYHSPEESLLSSQSLSVGHVRTGRPVNEFGSLISNVRENPCRDSENEQIRILLERQKEQSLADCRGDSETRVPNRFW